VVVEVVDVVSVVPAPAPVVSVLVSPPRPVAPPPVGVVVTLVSVLAELVPAPGSELEDDEELELEFDPELVFELGVVVEPDFVAVDGEAVPVVGTVNAGAPTVLPELEPPLPQAARANAASTAAAHASRVRVAGSETLCFNPTPNRCDERLAGNGIHPLPAPRAVEQILLRQLVAVAAETKILDRPGQLGRGRGERQQLGHNLELLPGVLVEVDLVRLRLDHDLASVGRSAQAVSLKDSHGRRLVVMLFGQRFDVAAHIPYPEADRDDQDDGADDRPADPDRRADHEQRGADRNGQRDYRSAWEMDLLADRRHRLGLGADVLGLV
jgi:hypothetical protein